MRSLESRALDVISDLADPDNRQQAAERLARALCGEDLVLFAPDPELGVLLPALGLPQTLRGSAEWRSFLAACGPTGVHTGTLIGEGGEPAPAAGIATEDGTVAVLMSAGSEAALESLRPVLPLLGALFRNERAITTGEVRVRSALEAAGRAETLTEALQTMRVKLENALTSAGEARAQARERAEEAEAYAEELQAQAVQLEEQTTQLEMLNDELAARTNEAERSRQAADAANRAKSEFLANMSHELRTPINAVIGYTELLDMGVTGPVTAKQRGQLERIRASSAHLLTLVNNVLDLAKVEAGRMRLENRREVAAEVVAEAVALVEMQAKERGIALKSTCSNEEVTYVGDKDRVRQILANLLSNAVKFTQEGGSVSVVCDVTEEEVEATELKGPGPWMYVAVADTGIGLDSEEVQRVFQPFVQAQSGRTRSHGGTGLGLTISRQLARLMGGDLNASSDPGVGSRFTLWLPSNQAAAGTLDASIRVGAGGRVGWPAGLAAAGQTLQAKLPEILAAFEIRIRSTAPVDGLDESEVLDHIPTLVADIARVAMSLGRSGGDPSTLRGKADVQRVIAERHGADRARRAWTTADLKHEFEVLREEIARIVTSDAAPRGNVDIEGALDLFDQLLDWAKRASLRSHHAAIVGDPELSRS